MVPPLTLCAYMKKKAPTCVGASFNARVGDEGDRTPDLLTASQRSPTELRPDAKK